MTSKRRIEANRRNSQKSTGPRAVLSRYEATLERSFYRALHELERLQAARLGQAVPLPEAVDVSVSGSEEAAEMALFGRKRGFSGIEIEAVSE
jgi:hypothetical protein